MSDGRSIGAVICAMLGGGGAGGRARLARGDQIATGSDGGTYDVYGEGLAKSSPATSASVSR